MQDISNLTPGMQQYMEVKSQHKDCIILFRMGDFYETFYDDAKLVSKELEITLTSRGKGEKKAPLAGIPYHSLDPYLAKLVKKGHKVAIVEQLEDPKKAKGLVKRGLIRIVTPGTVLESNILDSKSNNYIMSLYPLYDKIGIAFADISTGELLASEIDEESLPSQLTRFSPQECLIPESLKVNSDLLKKITCFTSSIPDHSFNSQNAKAVILEHFRVLNLEGFGIEGKDTIVSAVGAMLSYLQETQKTSLSYINRIRFFSSSDYMQIDSSTVRNLELLKNIRTGDEKGSLISVLDRTLTSMGSRLLRRWVLQPLLSVSSINKRLDAIEELTKNSIIREELKELLKKVSDIERLITRVNYGNANARDLISLRNSLQMIPLIKQHLKLDPELIKNISNMPDSHEVIDIISSSIKEEPHYTLRDGNLIKKGFNKELDELRDISSGGKEFIASLEKKEKEKTGIQNLRVSFNNIFGYYIEISKSNLNKVPEHYIRKQTLVNGERFVTPELKEKESTILNAEERINELEFEIFQKVLSDVKDYSASIKKASSKIALLDCLLSLSYAAVNNDYVRPIVEESLKLELTDSRHPVVETIEDAFIPNDCSLDPENSLAIITGPNMAGKSTFLRQILLIQLMAQIGSFVPCSKATLGIVDRIFSRVGAYDDLTSGQSTFMVEMNETANILNNASERSLIILDEIGRGTSTFDGISLAWAIAEYIHQSIRARTLFATHYHQLNKLAEKYKGIKNFNIAVKENKDEIIFLRKIIEGGTDKSYGIQVAKLAGLPQDVIENSKRIMTRLEMEDEIAERIHKDIKNKKDESIKQLSLFDL